MTGQETPEELAELAVIGLDPKQRFEQETGLKVTTRDEVTMRTWEKTHPDKVARFAAATPEELAAFAKYKADFLEPRQEPPTLSDVMESSEVWSFDRWLEIDAFRQTRHDENQLLRAQLAETNPAWLAEFNAEHVSRSVAARSTCEPSLADWLRRKQLVLLGVPDSGGDKWHLSSLSPETRARLLFDGKALP